MALIPKRVKYRKAHRGRRTGKATRGYTIAFGNFGLKAMEEHLNRTASSCAPDNEHQF